MSDPPPEIRRETLEELFVSHLPLVERIIAFVCSRHHVLASEADDFASDVKLRLVDNDYAVLRAFRHGSSLRTYLTVVIQRMFYDFRIRAWGKWRPSAEAKRAGPVALLLERLLVRDGHRFEEAFELLANHGVSLERAACERLAARLPARDRRRFESDKELVNMASNSPSPDELVSSAELDMTAVQISQALRKVLLRLPGEDRLILALSFEDGRSVSEIAAVMSLDQRRLYRRVDRLLRLLRAELEAEGLDGQKVRSVLESSTATVEWTSAASGELSTTSPSLTKGVRPWR